MLSRKSKKQPSPIIESQGFEAHEKPLNKKLDKESQDFFETLSSIAQSIKVYKFEDLKAATDNFSPSCWIKGSVYRGLINGDFAAIKKMNGDVSKEINLLNKINHSNLIRLSGVCFNDCHWYLIYEYAANGPLSDWIYDRSNEGMFLNWTKRIQIASDVAMGLDYLHSFTNYPHVHKDIKSSNILLDSDLRAKIAKFALARSTDGLDGEFALTRHIVGTKGYMAPEYLENGLVSTKLDVYAFGVLTMEIITGKEVAALYREENRNLSDVLDGVLSEEDGQEDRLKQLIDPSLNENYPSGLALLVVRLIGRCLNKNPGDRPTMDEILQSLSGILTASLAWEMSNNASGYHISS
uniref:Protein kinase domain-containing protein n=1 Tax=Salix viminalis TaxID=40686 RepID=A0A6N2N7L4_SALVM